MRDAYKAINKKFDPSEPDIKSYVDVVDIDNDGKITAGDIE